MLVKRNTLMTRDEKLLFFLAASRGRESARRAKSLAWEIRAYSGNVSDAPGKRRVSLGELQRELSQVAPVEADDFEALAESLSKLLRPDSGDGTKRLDKRAVWERVSAEIDSAEADSAE
jgi:hypothetical protein